MAVAETESRRYGGDGEEELSEDSMRAGQHALGAGVGSSQHGNAAGMVACWCFSLQQKWHRGPTTSSAPFPVLERGSAVSLWKHLPVPLLLHQPAARQVDQGISRAMGSMFFS